MAISLLEPCIPRRIRRAWINPPRDSRAGNLAANLMQISWFVIIFPRKKAILGYHLVMTMFNSKLLVYQRVICLPLEYTIWLWLTVRHGKIHHAFKNGKPSISIRAIIFHGELLVITRGYMGYVCTKLIWVLSSNVGNVVEPNPTQKKNIPA